MKLLFYSPVFAPHIGGVETITMSIARGLAGIRDANGVPEFDLTFVSQTPADGFNDSELPFKVFRQPRLKQLRRLIRSSDLIHVAAPAMAPIAFGLLAHKPVVVEHHGFQVICPNGSLLIAPSGVPCTGHFMAGQHRHCLRCHPNNDSITAFTRWLLTFVRRTLCKKVAANIMPTEWLSTQLNLPNSVTIPHGIVLPSPRIQSQRDSHRPLIVFQGRLVSSKGVDLLLQAAAILRAENRNFELVIIGDGPERATLQNLAVRLDLASQVRFAGRLGDAEVEKISGKADIVVVPSMGAEVFGLVVAENMSRGQAVVASDLGAFVEVLGNAGLTFPVGDFHTLAQRLRQLLDDAALAPSLGLRARDRIRETYQSDQMVHRHAELYRQVLAAD
jgi:glycogen synthase